MFLPFRPLPFYRHFAKGHLVVGPISSHILLSLWLSPEYRKRVGGNRSLFAVRSRMPSGNDICAGFRIFADAIPKRGLATTGP